jgi:hypothetical protein
MQSYFKFARGTDFSRQKSIDVTVQAMLLLDPLRVSASTAFGNALMSHYCILAAQNR